MELEPVAAARAEADSAGSPAVVVLGPDDAAAKGDDGVEGGKMDDGGAEESGQAERKSSLFRFVSEDLGDEHRARALQLDYLDDAGEAFVQDDEELLSPGYFGLPEPEPESVEGSVSDRDRGRRQLRPARAPALASPRRTFALGPAAGSR